MNDLASCSDDLLVVLTASAGGSETSAFAALEARLTGEIRPESIRLWK